MLLLPFLALIVGLSPVTGAAAAQAPSAASAVPDVPPNALAIENSGSTNFYGYRIVLTPDGRATIELPGGEVRAASVAPEHARQLFDRLQALGSLDSLPSAHCAKSASFGTTTTLFWKGIRSPDLSCGSDETVTALNRDIAQIVNELGVKPQKRHFRSWNV